MLCGAQHSGLVICEITPGWWPGPPQTCVAGFPLQNAPLPGEPPYEDQDQHLKDAEKAGQADHQQARDEMKGRWRNPIKGMGWYRATKKAFAELPED